MDDLDIDMEELESRLYSQIYHASAETENQSASKELESNSNSIFKRPSRYFQGQPAKPQPKISDFIPLGDNDPPPENARPYQVREIFDGRYYDGMRSIPQNLIRLLHPCNNIVVLPEAPTKIISQNLLPKTKSKNYEKYMGRQHMRELKKQRKIERNKKRRQMKKQLKKSQSQDRSVSKDQEEIVNNNKILSAHSRATKPTSYTVTKDDVITLSDSDVSDCVEVLEKRELVVLSSDDESKPVIKEEKKKESSVSGDSKLKNDDDVIFIEPVPKQVEVIEIDCDSVNISLNDEKQSETASTNSDHLKVPDIPRKLKSFNKHHRELHTPDSSASNDFLDTTVDLHQTKFNFGLHGSDFGNTNSSRAKPADISETDSTTSDTTTSKTNYFNVIDFETPSKQFFDDNNLESFSNYITPDRTNQKKIKPANFEQICTRASRRHTSVPHDSSGSSSESDYDENKVSYLTKRLPELSAVRVETEVVDKDDSLGAEEIPVEPKQMPDKNNAKRKSEYDDTSNKKQKVEDAANEKEEVTTLADSREEANQCRDDIEIGDHSDFIIIDETGEEDDVYETHSDDSESYFSCDEFNNVGSDLMLGNCRSQEDGKGDGSTSARKLDNSKGQEADYSNYSVEEVHRTMSDDPNLWKILDIDRLRFRYATPRGPRCHRCREVGHMALHCTNKQGPPACTLCGERTHSEPRCPMAMCTSCGRLGGHTTYCSHCAHWRNIQCNICKLYGHIDAVCPDAWRRYHLTTKPGPIVKPAVQTLKREKERWCSGCAKSGHFESTCRRYNRTHFAVYPEVLHYVDLYNFPKSQPYVIHEEDKETKDEQAVPEECFHDAESGSPDKTNVESSTKEDTNEMYFKVNFPPNFIPPYFRTQMDYLKKKHLPGEKSKDDQSTGEVSSMESLKETASNSTKSSTSASLRESLDGQNQKNANSSVGTKEKSSKINSRRSPHQKKSSEFCQIVKLNRFQFAYINSKHGMSFLNGIRRRPGIQLVLDEYEDSAAGEICLTSSSESNVVNAKRDVLQFLRSMPCINDIPHESGDMLQFLLNNKDMLDKAEGNCWTLCKKLCRLTNIGNRDGYSQQTSEMKVNIQVTIQLLLFGKLKLEHGSEHFYKLLKWIRIMRKRPNYMLSLTEIFDIYHSYAYIFEPRKSIFPLKHLCAQHDHYILPTLKQQKMPPKNRIFVENKIKFVMDTCEKFNLPNKFMTELMTIQEAMHTSKYSRSSYGNFLRFMSRFRTYMKRHKIL